MNLNWFFKEWGGHGSIVDHEGHDLSLEKNMSTSHAISLVLCLHALVSAMFLLPCLLVAPFPGLTIVLGTRLACWYTSKN